MRITRNNLKLSFSRPKYYINEKKGITKCYLEAELLMPRIPSGQCLISNGSTHFCTKYTAVCRGTDKFSVEKGKKIALAMAETNLYNQALEQLKPSIQYYRNFSFIEGMLATFEKKAKAHNLHNDVYIESITD